MNIENDRRRHPHLRVVYENACRITAPFFDPENGWGSSPLTLYARQALCEAHPELTGQDIAILLAAVHSFHKAHLNK